MQLAFRIRIRISYSCCGCFKLNLWPFQQYCQRKMRQFKGGQAICAHRYLLRQKQLTSRSRGQANQMYFSPLQWHPTIWMVLDYFFKQIEMWRKPRSFAILKLQNLDFPSPIQNFGHVVPSKTTVDECGEQNLRISDCDIHSTQQPWKICTCLRHVEALILVCHVRQTTTQ